MSDLYAKVLEIALREENSEVRVQLGRFFKENPEYRAGEDDEDKEFIDADPTEDGATFLESGRFAMLPLEEFDMPSPGNYVRIDVVSR